MSSIGEFPSLHILTNICYLCSFWWYSCWQMWGDISMWFWFAFPWWLTMLHIFSCACWLLVCPLWKNVYAGLLSIFQLDCLLFRYCMSCLYILDFQWVFSFLASSGGCQLLVFFAFIDVSFESLPSSSHDISMCVFVFTWPASYRDTNYIGVWSNLNLVASATTLFPNKITSWSTGH